MASPERLREREHLEGLQILDANRPIGRLINQSNMNLMDFKQEECTNAHCEVSASRAIGVEKDLEFAECALRRMLVRFGQVITCVLQTCYSRLHLIFALTGVNEP